MKEMCENYEAAADLFDQVGHERFNDIMEMVCEACWAYPDTYDPSVCITDKHRFDAINSVCSGTVEIDGEDWDFQIENGDWRGTWILAFSKDGSVGRYEPELPDPIFLIPADPSIVPGHHMWQVYLAWRKDWIPELER